jgi:hypothetical protein
MGQRQLVRSHESQANRWKVGRWYANAQPWLRVGHLEAALLDSPGLTLRRPMRQILFVLRTQDSIE